RYADDILILSGSRAGAENALRVAQSYLEEELKLTVNVTKTHIAHSDEGVKFLGVVIHTNYTRIQDKKVVKLKQKLKALTKRNRGIGLAAIIRELNPVLRGFVSYFRVANCARVLKQVMRWLRRRLRCIQLKQWKKSRAGCIGG
ncbi:group II intron maturase-specific domain-containing protein, partial [Vreelandella aquamarina]|uniref:group II intron maturase-specific domain-containing protein n=1 Tax=Vreelandella aquamarina TaxID=77097 RepID=UPI000B08EEDC